MSKSRTNAGKFDRNDFTRALLTETLPADIPVIIDNVGLRDNINDKNLHPVIQEIINKTVLRNDQSYTIPYRFKIARGNLGFRQLSLLHPSAEVQVYEFYRSYDHLVTYYATRSKFSIRYPSKVGTKFFYSNPYADFQKYKSTEVDLEGTELYNKYPSSYFSYGGVKRFYKYFLSDEFISFEKKYAYMAMADISKCFSSIYTHTITWCVKDRDKGKEHPRAVSFGNDFDRLMQKMNYNETNGIPVGPEISRIFSEVILQHIDNLIEKSLLEDGISESFDYQIRRYVDDYIIFCTNEKLLQNIIRTIDKCLNEVNLGLNPSKTEFFSRPFQTKTSAINEAAISITNSFWNNYARSENNPNRSLSKIIYNIQSVSFSYIKEIKKACHENQSSYSEVSGTIISLLEKRLQFLIHTVDENRLLSEDQIINQLSLMICILEIIFFFFNVNPKADSAPKITRATVLVIRFATKHLPDFTPVVSDKISELCRDAMDALAMYGVGEKNFVPVDLLNLLLSLSEIEYPYVNNMKRGIEAVYEKYKNDYFTIVTLLFIIKKNSYFGSLKQKIELDIINYIESGFNPKVKSMDLHLSLDLLSCPYASSKLKDKVLSKLLTSISVTIGKPKRVPILKAFEKTRWFVQWDKIDLLRSLERVELNSVY